MTSQIMTIYDVIKGKEAFLNIQKKIPVRDPIQEYSWILSIELENEVLKTSNWSSQAFDDGIDESWVLTLIR